MMGMQLDEMSRRVLLHSQNHVLLGVVSRDLAQLRFYPTPDQSEHFTVVHATHNELLVTRAIDKSRWFGFSISFVNGEIRWFNRASVLNDDDPDCLLSERIAWQVIEALGRRRAADFQVFPAR
jgi:hypothetical protein